MTYIKEMVTKVNLVHKPIRKNPLNFRAYPQSASRAIILTRKEMQKGTKRASKQLQEGAFYIVSAPGKIVAVFTKGEMKQIRAMKPFRRKKT